MEIPGDYRRRSIALRDAPSEDERRELALHQGGLVAALAPAEQATALRTIAKLIAGFPSFGMDAGAARQTVALYAEACRALPSWALEAARQAFAAGTNRVTWDQSRCPTSAQFAAEARLHVQAKADELAEVTTVLDAKVTDKIGLTDEERAVGLALLQQAKADIARTNDVSDTPEKRRRAAFRRDADRQLARDHAAMAAAGIAPPMLGSFPISAALAAQLEARKPSDIAAKTEEAA